MNRGRKRDTDGQRLGYRWTDRDRDTDRQDRDMNRDIDEQ
jgi:hypothetical protein